MNEPRIDRVSLTDESAWAGPGDDTVFVGVHAAGEVGWYGPISAEIGHYVSAVLAGAVDGVKVRDHSGLQAALRAAIGSNITTTGSWAVGAIDCAAWDLHGRLDNVPAAALLSGRRLSPVPLYASWLSLDLSCQRALDTVAAVGRCGWEFTKWSLRRQPDRDPAHDADKLARTVAAVATALERPPAFDAVFTWDRALIARFATRVDPAHLRWLEDPLPDTDTDQYRTVGEVPLAVGERARLDTDIDGLLGIQPVALTLDVVGCGGLTPAVAISAAAHAAGVPVYPHGRSFTPGLHLAAAFPDRVVGVEYQLRWEPSRQRLYSNPTTPAAGAAAAPTLPGLGITPEEPLMPQAPTVLPVTGTVAHDHAGQPVLVLTRRIDGQDTFLTGTLELNPEQKIEVRILTLDDVSVLRASEAAELPSVGAAWAGLLHLPHGLRTLRIPDDLATAATAKGRSLDTLDAAELRYALTFLGEATTPAIREARIEAITNALPNSAPPAGHTA